jgi:hypothetical protein
LSGSKQGEEEGGMDLYVLIGSRGETEVDYGIVNEEGWERVEEFRIGEIVDHPPLEISIEKMYQEERGKKRQNKDDQRVELYRRRLKEARFQEQEVLAITHSDELYYSPSARDTKSS